MVEFGIADVAEFTFGLAFLAEGQGEVDLPRDLRAIAHDILDGTGAKRGKRNHSRSDGRMDGVRRW